MPIVAEPSVLSNDCDSVENAYEFGSRIEIESFSLKYILIDPKYFPDELGLLSILLENVVKPRSSYAES